jgi:hypothetical protein
MWLTLINTKISSNNKNSPALDLGIARHAAPRKVEGFLIKIGNPVRILVIFLTRFAQQYCTFECKFSNFRVWSATCLPIRGSVMLPTLLGKDPCMPALTSPSVDIPYICAMLNSAKDVVVQHHDQDLIEKITVLRGYFELSQTSPKRNYGPIVRRAARELDGALRRHRSESRRQRESQCRSFDIHGLEAE